MFIYGELITGQVDRLPGVYHVRTTFIHLWFFPLFPSQSTLYLETESSAAPCIELEYLCWKSVSIAWLRALSIATVVFSLLSLLYGWPKRGFFTSTQMLCIYSAAIVWGLSLLALIPPQATREEYFAMVQERFG